MLRFAVTKDGAFVGRPFDSREEALEVAELEKLADPYADVRVLPVLTAGEGLDPDEGQALVDAILEGEDFSDLPPEHLAPVRSQDDEQGGAISDADPGHGGSGKKPTEHGKKAETAPPKGLSYFVRHPFHLPVADGVLEELWTRDTVAVCVPGEDAGGKGPGAPKPSNHKKHGENMAAKHLADLALWGGYAWAETRVKPGIAKVGRVVPQQPGDVRVVWIAPKHPKHLDGNSGKEVVLRTVRLEDVREVDLSEATALRAVRPLGGTIWPWPAAAPRLEALVEGVPLERTWANLTPLQRRAACAEFLRANRNPEYPKLQFLLVPDGSRLEEVDILGLAEDGTEIRARITSSKKGSPRPRLEARQLKNKHHRPGQRLLLFYVSSGSANPADSTPSLFPTEPFQVLPEDGVLLVPVEEVLAWVRRQSFYADKLFSL